MWKPSFRVRTVNGWIFCGSGGENQMDSRDQFANGADDDDCDDHCNDHDDHDERNETKCDDYNDAGDVDSGSSFAVIAGQIFAITTIDKLQTKCNTQCVLVPFLWPNIWPICGGIQKILFLSQKARRATMDLQMLAGFANFRTLFT